MDEHSSTSTLVNDTENNILGLFKENRIANWSSFAMNKENVSIDVTREDILSKNSL